MMWIETIKTKKVIENIYVQRMICCGIWHVKANKARSKNYLHIQTY